MANSSQPLFLPHGLSSQQPGDNFKQRTFLGASIRKFSVNAGFGQNSSTLGVDLVEDIKGTGDGTALGLGQDPYHRGNGLPDKFTPPPVGSPVFFAFGDNGFPTTHDSFYKALDDAYGTSYADPSIFGYNDLAFGGILQTYNQSRSTNGDPLYSVQVTDPREILSNTEIVLRNYGGTTFNNQNMFNVYGFLEYNSNVKPADIAGTFGTADPLVGDETGYSGTDMYYNGQVAVDGITYQESLGFDTSGGFIPGQPPRIFPITGTGFSRVGPQGIPYYRIVQALNAMMGLNGELPAEYVAAGFGGVVNFRGFNYVIDMGGLPLLNQFYFFNYDRMSLMDFMLEVCEVTSHELLVSLLPVIDHPAIQSIYQYNRANEKDPSKMIFGIIRIDAIDRTSAQQPGSIKRYLDQTYDQKTVTNTDLGVELANVTTDKFIAGGQETELHFFSGHDDRKDERNNSWSIQKALKQQILPYYGTLRSGAVTIPKGYGAYQQILLDASQLYAEGVDSYYVATEMELRAALVSFERWRDFLLMYNDLYMESKELDDIEQGQALAGTVAGPGAEAQKVSQTYAVTVPRCLWVNQNESYDAKAGLPNDACFPPYGYPLYYKRAERIGINPIGYASANQSFIRIISSIAQLEGSDPNKFVGMIKSLWQSMNDAEQGWNKERTKAEKEFIEYIQDLMDDIKDGGKVDRAATIGLLQKVANNLTPVINLSNQASKKLLTNAQKIYQFVRKIASENLGKKYLVKIPKEPNVAWDETILTNPNGSIKQGPFGFKARPKNNDPRTAETPEFQSMVERQRVNGTSIIHGFLSSNDAPNPTGVGGALDVGYNPITGSFVTNYSPAPQGGWVDYALFANNAHIKQALMPIDIEPVVDGRNNRFKCYVRFDNSQELSFGSVPRNSFVQQVVTGGQFVPDVNYQLDNTTNGAPASIDPDNPASSGPKSVGFVAAQLEPNFYYAPRLLFTNALVHGRETEDIGKNSLPTRIANCDGGFDNSFAAFTSDFRPVPPTSDSKREAMEEKEEGSTSGIPPNVIGTKIEVLADGSSSDESLKDTDHVYALITLPARITPTIDSRLRDGLLQQYNTEQVKHAMAQDVVVGIPGFDQPAVAGTAKMTIDTLTLEPISNDARQAIKQARANLAFGLPQSINWASPSPVFPDMVAIPLMSAERCYGPWTSSTIGAYTNIGGNIEYEKDENLAPWNYSGYDLMNQAGNLKAQFSNSQFLYSERGSFSIPDAPKGLSIGRYLIAQGPLVTNIGVNIDATGGIKTSCSMDLYTASFGKMQKQRENQIAQINRNKQKQVDEANLAARQGMAKSQVDNTTSIIQQAIKDANPFEGLDPSQSPGYSSPSITTPSTMTAVTMKPTPEKASLVANGGGLADAEGIETRQGYTPAGGIMPGTAVGEVNDKFADLSQAGQSHYLTGAKDVNEDTIAFSNSPAHKAMPAKANQSFASKRKSYTNQVDNPAEWS